MSQVHIFVSSGRFKTIDELYNFVHASYSEDGEIIPSQFMLQVGLKNYEPSCIEISQSESGIATPLNTLLDGTSYSERWLSSLGEGITAEMSVCIFTPNTLSSPASGSLEYVGIFGYAAT